ncbi:MAG TPA: ATP-dependent Clp protease proteolytic subunit, partial [Candidatus Hydrogenedentes bacterium]|nr:ATP-dependent Clp protease proteolytic subunit [Candidatus Hydrogenedentota bacterium]
MRTIRFAASIFLVAGIVAFGNSEPTSHIVTVRLDGMVDDGMSVLAARAIREAANADAIVFIVDTPGGLVDAAINISDLIVKAPCKTIAYIDGMGAISAGALISYACDEIVMSPSTNMGAAQPVTFGSSGTEPLGEKETSFVRAKFAALAEMKGRNPDIAMAMVDKDIELRAYQKQDGTVEIRGNSRPQPRSFGSEIIDKFGKSPEETVKGIVEVIIGEKLPELPGAPVTPTEENKAAESQEAVAEDTVPDAVEEDDGVIIEAAGKLLTLTPKEAQKYGVITHIAKDLEQLQWQLNLMNAAVVKVEPTWSEGLYRWLISPQIATLLLVIGVGGLYIEIKTPGFGLPGALGIAA